MKKIIVMVVTVMWVTISGCSNESKPIKVDHELTKDSENYHLNVREYTYEGCEYIKVGFGNDCWGSHKGNCKNPIHCNNK